MSQNNIYIPHQVASDFLPDNRRHFPISQYFEIYSYFCHIFCNYVHIQKFLLFLLSISFGCFTLVGISMPYLWGVFLILVLNLDSIISNFYNIYVTHYTKAGSSVMLWALEIMRSQQGATPSSFSRLSMILSCYPTSQVGTIQ